MSMQVTNTGSSTETAGGITLPFNTLYMTSPFTLACWVYLDSACAASGLGVLLDTWGGSDAQRAFNMAVDENCKLSFAARVNTSTTRSVASTNAIALATWTHVMATWVNASGGAIFINGAAEGTIGTGTINSPTTQLLGVGGRWNVAGSKLIYGHDGRIFDARIYNRAISAAEIKMLVAAKGKDNIVNGLQLRTCILGGAVGAAPAIIDLSYTKAVSTNRASPLAGADPFGIGRPPLG